MSATSSCWRSQAEADAAAVGGRAPCRTALFAKTLSAHGANAFTGLLRAVGGGNGVSPSTALAQLFVSLLPMLAVAAILAVTYSVATAPVKVRGFEFVCLRVRWLARDVGGA